MSTATGAASGEPGAAAPGPSDPFGMVLPEVEAISQRLMKTAPAELPVLAAVAVHLFQPGHEGKRLRPSCILLMATALAEEAPGPDMMVIDTAHHSAYPALLRRRQQRVAESAELFHVASLMHDDVIDHADKRRNLKATNVMFGNKMAILGGDFLLARASMALASTRSPEVVALGAQVVEDLVVGEVLQMHAAAAAENSKIALEKYMKKTYFKTASLLANFVKAVAVLAGCTPDQAQAAFDYGRHVGLAFQIIDDVLDFTATEEELGKPAGHDLQEGLATAPVLFAAEEHPELWPMIKRRFKEGDDAERALQLVHASEGLARSRELAVEHVALAVEALGRLPPARCAAAEDAHEALVTITRKVLSRKT